MTRQEVVEGMITGLVAMLGKHTSKWRDSMRLQIRQGDVLIEQVDEVPVGAEEISREGGRVILAAGEATGHHHAIADRGVKFFRHADHEDRFLEVSTRHKRRGASLRHEEHSTHAIPGGVHRVIGQEEYSPAEIRRVVD